MGTMKKKWEESIEKEEVTNSSEDCHVCFGIGHQETILLVLKR